MADEHEELGFRLEIRGERDKLDERAQETPEKEGPAPTPMPAYRRWLHALDVDGLIELFSDPLGGGMHNEELRAEILELIRQKGGDSAVRRALGLHFVQPGSLDEGSQGGHSEHSPAWLDPWLRPFSSGPGRRTALDQVGRSWLEAALFSWWEDLRQRQSERGADASIADALLGQSTGAPYDLCAALNDGWPELLPPRPPEGAPGLSIDLRGPRRADNPMGRLLQLRSALVSILSVADPATSFVSLFGRIERSDGSQRPVVCFKSSGLDEEAVEKAIDELLEPGIWLGRIERLFLFTRPVLAYSREEDGLWLGPCPQEGLPDPLRPGPLWLEIAPPASTMNIRVHMDPTCGAGIAGVMNHERALGFLQRLSNLGFLPGADPAARLPVMAPVTARWHQDGVAVTLRQRPGDRFAAAIFEGEPEAIVPLRRQLLDGASEDARRAARLTEPTGPIPLDPDVAPDFAKRIGRQGP